MKLFTVATLFGASAAQLLGSNSLRFGTTAYWRNTDSISSFGNLEQPFYTLNGANWYKLTYSSYALDFRAVTSDGTVILNSDWGGTATPLTIDNSAFTGTVGTIKVTTTSQGFEIVRSYTIADPGAKSMTCVVSIKNTGSSFKTVDAWWGTRDDWVGRTDRPTKTAGSISVSGGFTPAANTAEPGNNVVEIKSGSEVVYLSSPSADSVGIIDRCCSFGNVYRYKTMPRTTATGDGSYGIYLNFGEIAPGATESRQVVYAAGGMSAIAQVIESVTEATVAAASAAGIAIGDPHLALPHGGKADFRGEDKAIYNFVSGKGFSLNVMTQLADFELWPKDHPRHKKVHGSFLTQAHIVARTSSGKVVRTSFYADKIGAQNIGWANGTVDDGAVFSLGPQKNANIKQVDDVTLHMRYSSYRVITPEFEIMVTPIKFCEHNAPAEEYCPERNVQGLHHRLDVQTKLRVKESELSLPPHGIIGQGWDGDDLAIDGEQDEFPSTAGEFTTTAMAGGAIEGVADDYKVATKYATDFKYSRFDATTASVRNVKELVAAGKLNKPKKVATSADDFIGSTETVGGEGM